MRIKDFEVKEVIINFKNYFETREEPVSNTKECLDSSGEKEVIIYLGFGSI